jgi:hypothetical protein
LKQRFLEEEEVGNGLPELGVFTHLAYRAGRRFWGI